jgi:hypothetical protein
MVHNFYIIFIYLVTLFIYLFTLGFQHEVHTPHYYFECVVGLKVYKKISLCFDRNIFQCLLFIRIYFNYRYFIMIIFLKKGEL